MGQSFKDKALKHIAGMKNLEHLSLRQTQVRGPGLAHLKGFTKLEWLELGSTPFDDSGMPHIVANFPRLRRISLGNTKITPDGLMKLVDLHWLGTVGVPNDLVGPDFTKAKTKAERSRMIKERDQAKVELFGRFVKAFTLSKQKARAAGIDVPPDSTTPFGYQWSVFQRQQRDKKNDTSTGNQSNSKLKPRP